MGIGLQRSARRVCFVAAATCLLLAFVAPALRAQGADTVPRPDVFRGAASSQVASVQLDRDALLPVPELFRFIALDGSGTYESSSQQARSSLLFPGNGLILSPNLLCGTFGGQFPPQFKPILDACLQYKYPLTVFADSFAPDGASSGSLALGSPTDPVSANAVGAKAHAGEDAATTDAAMQDVRVLGLPAFGAVTPKIGQFEMDTSLFTVESATSRTNQRIVKGILVVDSDATLSGVRMIGGLLQIGSLRSASHVTDDGAGKRTADATLEVSGVTVGGVPAQITDKGLVVGSPAGGDGPLAQAQQSQINGLLKALNVKVTLLGSEKSIDKRGAAAANVGGVLVEFSHDVQGLPTIPLPKPIGELDPNGLYTGSIQLGATAALGSAASFPAFLPVTTPTSIPGPVGTGTPALDLPGTTIDGKSGGGSDVALPAPTGEGNRNNAPTLTRRGGPRTKVQLARSLGAIFGTRIRLLYLALMFATLALCIVPRFAVPARLPRRRS